MPDLRSNRDLIVDKIASITADQIDRTLICSVHIGVLTLKLGLGDARPQQGVPFEASYRCTVVNVGCVSEHKFPPRVRDAGLMAHRL